MWNSYRPASGLIVVMSLIAGCSESPDYPDFAEVRGTVTLDGKPLPNALIEFRPMATDVRGATGMTDEMGEYELVYTQKIKGAPIGKHQVLISTARDLESSIEKKELVPPRYNEKTELTADVEEGGKILDFHLKSK